MVEAKAKVGERGTHSVFLIVAGIMNKRSVVKRYLV
jgi:hypothetical protein